MDKIIQGDALSILKTLPDQCVQTCVTSPPYWGLRDYGVEGQLGLEEKPEQYVERLVAVFHEVRRVLKDNGTMWLNLGDTYGGSGGDTVGHLHRSFAAHGGFGKAATMRRRTSLVKKNLIGIPWRVAFALQTDGWLLRQDIIWHKPNPMPESARDRCTKAHEYIFLLSKSQQYYFNRDAIGEPISEGSIRRAYGGHNSKKAATGIYAISEESIKREHQKIREGKHTRNKRSVWTVSTKPYRGAHFATFPPDLIRPCILAGAPPQYTVLDPFMGSGTTALVAKELHRHYLGIELNPAYIELARERLGETRLQGVA